MNAPHEEGVGAEREDHVHALQQHAVHEEPRVLDVAGDAVEDGVGAVDVEEAEAQALEFGVKLAREVRGRFRPGSGAR